MCPRDIRVSKISLARCENSLRIFTSRCPLAAQYSGRDPEPASEQDLAGEKLLARSIFWLSALQLLLLNTCIC